MQNGFIKTMVAAPVIKPGCIDENVNNIKQCMDEAAAEEVKILVFPMLTVTGATCGSLFWDQTFLQKADCAVKELVSYSGKYEMLCFVGYPYAYKEHLYNAVAVICMGQLLGITVQQEEICPDVLQLSRYFSYDLTDAVNGGPDLFDFLIDVKNIPGCRIAVCVGDTLHNLFDGDGFGVLKNRIQRANVLVVMSARPEIAGKRDTFKMLTETVSEETQSVVIWANAGYGESSTDRVFAGGSCIYECGDLLAEATLFGNAAITTEIDTQRCMLRKRKLRAGKDELYRDSSKCFVKEVSFSDKQTELTRKIMSNPYLSGDTKRDSQILYKMLMMQATGLAKRLTHIGCSKVVLGISGGLDSTLALLACVRAYDFLKMPHENIIAISMPGFGTTDRTRSNAQIMAEALGVTYRQIPIARSVLMHFDDIGHDENDHSVVYENAQARERTQILMDVANKEFGIVVGTGDLSEAALGFATFNGDHMSMYDVNSGIPKSMLKMLIRFEAEHTDDPKLSEVLTDVYDTPISPELLPSDGTHIVQCTEELVGPYELHDFFLYYMVNEGFSFEKILYMAEYAFGDSYDASVIQKWMKVFYKRFYSQQYKRNCMPDGPAVVPVSLSPRAGWMLPSDLEWKGWEE